VGEDVSREGGGAANTPQSRGWLERVGDDWWATLVAGVIVALAVANVLPKVPW
jgi:hypothetical protein